MIKNKVNTTLSILKDNYSSDHQALFSSYALNKFSLVFEELKIKYEDLEKVIEAVMKHDNTLVRNNFPITAFYDFYVLESDNCMLTFDSYDNKKKIQINYYFHSYQESQEIFDIIQSFRDEDEELFVSISSYFVDGQGKLSYNTSKKVASEFENNSLAYYPYIDTNEMFKQYLMSDSNILVLSGTPGTGKTKLGDAFMKYLLHSTTPEIKEKEEKIISGNILTDYDELDIITKESEGVKIAYVKNEDILSKDLFWNMLTEEEYHLVFLDDLDYSLLPRTQNISTSEDIQKNKFISNLLSFTDGIFENGNKTKFIITTNKEVKDIDTAVLRKGRTFDILQLRELNRLEAARIWESYELPVDKFKEDFPEGKDVLQADLGSAINLAIKARDKNVELKPYITEEGISVYSSVKNPSKIGL